MTQARFPTDAEGRLAVDFDCASCGYNLQGLQRGNACPECGTALRRSLRHDLLRFADPAWTGDLASGVTLLLASLAIDVVSVVAIGIAAGLIGYPAFHEALHVPVRLVAGVVYLTGVWRLTAASYPQTWTHDMRRLRSVTRPTNVAATLIGILAAVLLVFGFFLGSAVELIAYAVGVPAGFTLLMYLHRLALRLPDERLARRTVTLAWANASAVSAFVAVEAVSLALHWHVYHRVMRGGGVSTGAGLYGLGEFMENLLTVCRVGVYAAVLAVLVWWVVEMLRYRKRFHRAVHASWRGHATQRDASPG